MSILAIHAQGTRIIADVLEAEAASYVGNPDCYVMLSALANALRIAADRMEQTIRDEIAAFPGGCGLDHTALKTPRCPACGAPKSN